MRLFKRKRGYTSSKTLISDQRRKKIDTQKVRIQKKRLYVPHVQHYDAMPRILEHSATCAKLVAKLA